MIKVKAKGCLIRTPPVRPLLSHQSYTFLLLSSRFARRNSRLLRSRRCPRSTYVALKREPARRLPQSRRNNSRIPRQTSRKFLKQFYRYTVIGHSFSLEAPDIVRYIYLALLANKSPSQPFFGLVTQSNRCVTSLRDRCVTTQITAAKETTYEFDRTTTK